MSNEKIYTQEDAKVLVTSILTMIIRLYRDEKDVEETIKEFFCNPPPNIDLELLSLPGFKKLCFGSLLAFKEIVMEEE